MENKLLDSSVQKHPSASYNSVVLKWANFDNLLPRWWSSSRDAFLRDYWPQEDYIAATIYSVTTRNAQFEWSLSGLNEDVKVAQQMLQSANFGSGWNDFITKTSVDLLTTDNGAFWEVIRPAKIKLDGKVLPVQKMMYENDIPQWYAFDGAKTIALRDTDYKMFDSPLDLPIGIAHLDSGQCQRTGNPDIPVIYTDRYGKVHKLKWWQVVSFADMPSPIEKMNGVGICAVSRTFRTSHVLQSIEIYKDEKISGRHNRAIHITNADPDLLNDQIDEMQARASNAGQLRFISPIVASTFDPSATPQVATINLADVPDGFDENVTKNWAIAVLALAFGVDYGFLAPLPGKGLGTASQSETQAKQAKGKSSLQFRNMITQALNFRGILPESVQFIYDDNDIDAQETNAKIAKIEVENTNIMLSVGIITPTVARQMLADKGIIDESYLAMMDQQDITPKETIEGNQNIDAEEAIEDEMKCKCGNHSVHTKAIGEYNIDYGQVKSRHQILYQKQSLAQKIFNAARNLFRAKQIPIPETPSQETNLALAGYSEQLESLVLQAYAREIEQSAFEEAMLELVIESIIAIYAQEAGIPIDEISEANLTPLENIIARNEESIIKLSNDIYGERYDDDAEGPGILGLLTRLGLWVSVAATAGWLGMLYNGDNAEDKFEWVLNPLKENCESCIALDGQVHTASEWAEFGVYPKSGRLFCNGFNCGCNLNSVPKSTTVQGDLGSVPLQ